MRTVGVRDLRQNLSRHLKVVKEGEPIDVTERGRVVARIVPAEREPSVYTELAERFGATIPVGRLQDVPLPEHQLAPDGTTDAFLDESRKH